MMFLVATRVCACVWGAPIGDGHQRCSVTFAGAPGFFKGQKVLTHPVTSGTVPLPALNQERIRFSLVLKKSGSGGSVI